MPSPQTVTHSPEAETTIPKEQLMQDSCKLESTEQLTQFYINEQLASQKVLFNLYGLTQREHPETVH